MATKTINRMPRAVDIRGLNEQYFNFSTFKGLCDAKNYLDVDQQTFQEVDNLYVDQDNQLSSRPPIKRVDFLHADEYVLKIYRINSMVIYHTKKTTLPNEYYVHFKYKDTWYSQKVTERINIMWFDERYVIFMENDIISFNYNYELQSIQWFDGEATIYTPVTEIVSNGIKQTNKDDQNIDSANVLTTNRLTRYIFDNTTFIDSVTDASLQGKSVIINIGDEQFSIIWQVNSDKIITTSIGSYDATLIRVSSKGTYLAVNPQSSKVYYSLDGTLFYTINLPAGVTNNPVFADDGSSLWVIHFNDVSNATLYHMTLTSIAMDIVNLTWIATNFSPPSSYDTNLWSGDITQNNRKYMNGTRWSNFNFGQTNYGWEEFGHSPEDGKCAWIVPITGTFSAYRYEGEGFETKGTPYSSTDNMLALFIFVNDNISIYPIHMWEDYLPASSGYIHGNKIRLVPSNSIPIISVSWTSNGGSPGSISSTGTQFRGLIVLNNLYAPYVHFKSTYSVGNINVIARSYFVNYDLLDNVGRLALNNWYVQDISMQLIGGVYTISHAYSTKQSASLGNDVLYTNTFSDIKISSNWPTNFTDTIVYTFGFVDIPGRSETPVTLDETKNTSIIGTFTPGSMRMNMYKVSASGDVLTTNYFRYAKNNISLLQRKTNDVINPITPLYCQDGDIVYQDNITKNIYVNKYFGKIYVDLFIKGKHNYFVPELVTTFIANVVSANNKVYIANKREGKVYFPVNEVLSFANEITAIVIFSQTSLGIFLEDEVHELVYSDDVYRLSRTKLQLGCRKDSEILLNYDGKSIFITTLKGLNALNYQDFVQSTEQVYNYLTENIMSIYDDYSSSPLKLTQYKNWIFMYRTDATHFYLLDLRGNSWWKWTNIDNIQQIIFDGDNLLLLIDGVIYKYDFAFDGDNYFDDVGQMINWSFMSQRLHFGAPNNYKHIKSLSVITSSEQDSSFRCKLGFKNYRNLSNLLETDVVEYDISELTTVIKKVNFLKTNAFQFFVTNDKDEILPREFVTPDIAIKYRVTERIR